jgi:endonuclease/exonuclease/phosphatase family metal-dependent hydrolase
MKIIYLNIWGGILFEDLRQFLLREASDTDIFCFSEVFDTPTRKVHLPRGARANTYAELRNALPDFEGYYAPCEYGFIYDAKPADFEISMGRSLPVLAHGSKHVLGETHSYDFVHQESMPRNIQHVRVATQSGSLVVANFHGVVDKASGKRDSDLTIRQFHAVIEYMREQPGPHIVGGDFNVYPTTECIALFERAGYRNLVREYGIELTRNRHYASMEQFADYVSDYAFASPGPVIEDFQVLPDVVSDHQALMLSISDEV